MALTARAVSAARVRSAARSRVGSPPPTRVTVRESAEARTVVGMRWSGPRAVRAATVVAILTVEAGVMGASAPFPYSRLPVAVSMTTALRRVPSAESFSRGSSTEPSPAAAPSWVSGADRSAAVPSAASTAGALGAGAGPAGASGS